MQKLWISARMQAGQEVEEDLDPAEGVPGHQLHWPHHWPPRQHPEAHAAVRKRSSIAARCNTRCNCNILPSTLGTCTCSVLKESAASEKTCSKPRQHNRLVAVCPQGNEHEDRDSGAGLREGGRGEGPAQRLRRGRGAARPRHRRQAGGRAFALDDTIDDFQECCDTCMIAT